MSNIFNHLATVVKYVGVLIVAESCIMIPPSLVPWYSPWSGPITLAGALLASIVIYLSYMRS